MGEPRVKFKICSAFHVVVVVVVFFFFFFTFSMKRGKVKVRMKISVSTDISVLEFYGYIGDISMDIFT